MIPNRRNKLTPEQKVQLVSDYRAGLPIALITEKFTINKTTLYRILKQTPEEL